MFQVQLDNHFLIEIFNNSGIKIMQQVVNKTMGLLSLNLSHLPSGTYYMRVTSTNSKEMLHILKI